MLVCIIVWGARTNDSKVGIPRKANKQTRIVVCLCMCVCGARANQRHTRHHRCSSMSEWPLLVRARAFVLGLFRWSLYCHCLSAGAHRDTKTHRHTHKQQPQETRTLTKVMKAPWKRRVEGPTTGCCSNKAACIEEKQRVRQPAARYTQKNKQKKNCMIVWGARANQS